MPRFIIIEQYHLDVSYQVEAEDLEAARKKIERTWIDVTALDSIASNEETALTYDVDKSPVGGQAFEADDEWMNTTDDPIEEWDL